LISASLYITVCTTRNRIRLRLRRLREPRYLIGAVVGAAYLYFALFAGRRRPSRRGRDDDRGPIEVVSAWQTIGTPLAGLAVFVLALLAWLLPARPGLLEFSRAETVFLFPAPVSRRELLVHRLLRSQVGSLVTSVVMAVFFAPSAGFGRLCFGLAMWSLFVTIRVYFAAVALTRAQFASPRLSARLAAWLPVAFLSVATVVVFTAIAQHMGRLPDASFSDFWLRLTGALAGGLPRIVLWPFIAILRPQFETSLTSFVPAMAGSLAVLAFVTVWMLANDGAFERAAGEAAGQRAGETRARTPTVRVRQVGPPLALSGRLEWAIFWKNAMQTFRAVNLPLRRLVGPAIGLVVGLSGAALGMSAGQNRGPAGFITALGFAVTVMSLFIGPLIMRLDLRSDFEHLELLKTWPVRPAELIRGEMAWPAAFVSAIAWAGILCTALFSGAAMPDVRLVDRWSFAVSALIAAPAAIAAQYTVQNALALFFPAWVALGNQRTRGIDAMGQRLIMLAAILVALALFAVPGGIAGGIVWLVLRNVIGALVFIPAAVVFAGVVLMEVLVATELLGPVYERMDLTSVEKPE
jgi:ABC-2 type transport system permease protein